MRSILPWIALVFSAAVIAQPVAAPTSTNAIVELYAQRLELAKLAVEKEERNLKTNEELLTQLTDTAKQGAVPWRSVIEMERQRDMSKIEVRVMQSRVKESAALLEIAKVRLRSGADMPLCQEKQ